MKRTLSLFLTAALALSLLAGCGPKPAADGSGSSVPGSSSSGAGSSQPEAPGSEQPGGSASEPGGNASQGFRLPNVMVLSGPTGVGAAKMMSDHDYAMAGISEELPRTPDGKLDLPERLRQTPDGKLDIIHSVEVVTDNQEVTNALINKDLDIAAIATNAAATLSAKSGGSIQVLAINTLGVLYILEKGDTVHSMADLAGKTLYAPSNTKGANPEHILNHLLEGNGVDPSEVNIEWLTPQEITAKITSSDAGICMLPVPAATALMVQDSAVREAVNMSEAWEDLEGSPLPMGCVVARTDYIEENPLGVEAFLSAYEASIRYMNDPANLADASALVAEYGFVPNAKVAEKAIPQCSLTFITGQEMKDTLEAYYEILFQAEPKSIGGGLPYDSFYYGVG